MKNEDLVSEEIPITTTSLKIAKAFSRPHKSVLGSIRSAIENADLKEGWFFKTTYLDDNNRPQIVYELTRDGFSILIMGFDGKKAYEWKKKYIAAFNAMERKLKSLAPIQIQMDHRNWVKEVTEELWKDDGRQLRFFDNKELKKLE